MSSETGALILDAMLTFIGKRISIVLLQPGNKDKNYITSLHNEVASIPTFLYQYPCLGHCSNLHLDLACGCLDCWPSTSVVWWQLSCSRVGQVAFHSFLDIRNPGSYTAPDVHLLPEVKAQRSDVPWFNFKEWWIIEEGGALEEPFDIRDKIVSGLLGALQTVSVCLDILSPLTNQGLQQEASTQFCARMLERFKIDKGDAV